MIGPPPYDEGRGRRDSCLVSTVTGRLVSDVWRCCTILGAPTDAFNTEKASEVYKYYTTSSIMAYMHGHRISGDWRHRGFCSQEEESGQEEDGGRVLISFLPGPLPWHCSAAHMFSLTRWYVDVDTLNKCFITTTYKINELQIAMFAHSPHYWKCSVTYCYIIASSAYSCKTPAIRCRIKATLWISRVRR